LKVYEDEAALCILDIAQLTSESEEFIRGRCLAIPKRHVAWFHELEDDEAGRLFVAARRVSSRIMRAFSPDFVAVFIRGMQIPHAHITLQPSFEGAPVDKVFEGLRHYFRLAPEELLREMHRSLLES